MQTWQQTRINATPIAAALMLVATLALGGAGGYAIRALAQSQDAVTASVASEAHGLVNPGIGLHRAELQDSAAVLGVPDIEGQGPVGRHNPGVGLHKLDLEERP